MSAPDQRKCAYAAWNAWWGVRSKTGSDYCFDSDGVRETEVQCDCKHAPCALG
jgi:hypothetical protein